MNPPTATGLVARLRAARLTRPRRTITADQPDLTLTAELVAAGLVAAGLATDARHITFRRPVERMPEQWQVFADLPGWYGPWDEDGSGFVQRRRFAAALGVDEENVVFDACTDHGRLCIDVYDRRPLDVIRDPWTGAAR